MCFPIIYIRRDDCFQKLEEESGVASTSGASSGAGNSESDADDKDPSKDKKKKNRCAVCRKKVGLTGMTTYFYLPMGEDDIKHSYLRHLEP